MWIVDTNVLTVGLQKHAQSFGVEFVACATERHKMSAIYMETK